MSGEPQRPDVGDKLDWGIAGLKQVWFGLFASGLVLTITLAAIVMSGEGAIADLGDWNYLFLLTLPLGLIGAYVVAPMMIPRDPAVSARSRGKTLNGWEGTKPDEPFHWFPAYGAYFLIRAGMLEGAAILASFGFFITAEWAVLGGAVVLLAALAAEIPTRSGVESYAASGQRRQAESEAGPSSTAKHL